MPLALLLLICKPTDRFYCGISLGSNNNTARDTALTLVTDIL